MGNKRRLTGFDAATIRVSHEGHVISTCVRRFENLPENLVEGEVERLEALVAFRGHTERELKRAASEHQREALRKLEEQI